MNSRLSSLLPILAAAFVLPACIPEHVGSQSNGSGGALNFQTVGSIAVGFTRTVDVERFDPQWQTCVIQKSVDLGGSTTPQDSCSHLHHEPIRPIGARCGDDSCTVEALPDDGSGVAHFRLTGRHDGSTFLHVDVQSTGSDATWGDDYPITTATPVRLGVVTQYSYANENGTTYASLPGAQFYWCPELYDAAGSALDVDDSSFANDVANASAVTVDDGGRSMVYPPCASFHATTPGASVLTFTAGGLSIAHTITVVDPNDIVAAELRTYEWGTSDRGEVGGDAEATLGASAVTSISLGKYDSATYASFLTMKDGTFALGGAGRWHSSSSEALDVYAYSGDLPEIASVAVAVDPVGSVIGDGTVDAQFGAVSVSIPFHIADEELGGELDAGR